METKKRCIVNFADSKWYPAGQKRLIEACKKHASNVDLITLSSYSEIGSPSHQANPYAFKIYAIEKALSLGYTTILYCDSSLYPVQNVDPLFDYIESNGHLMQLAGHYLKNWCNDNARNYFNITEEEWNSMVTFSAGFTGLDFTNERSVKFFEEWKRSMLAGAFKGNWTNDQRNNFSESKNKDVKGHRHDLTCGSIIATRLGMNFTDYLWMCYIGKGYSDPHPQSVFWCHPA